MQYEAMLNLAPSRLLTKPKALRPDPKLVEAQRKKEEAARKKAEALAERALQQSEHGQTDGGDGVDVNQDGKGDFGGNSDIRDRLVIQSVEIEVGTGGSSVKVTVKPKDGEEVTVREAEQAAQTFGESVQEAFDDFGEFTGLW